MEKGGGGVGNGILKLQSDLNYFIPRYNHWAVTQPVPHFKFLELKGGDGGIITVDTGEHSLGFCEDLSPDDKLYKVLDNLFLSSQDGARNLEELQQNNITHILNVGTGIENAFPKVIGHCWTWFSRFDNNIIQHLFLSSSEVLNLHILYFNHIEHHLLHIDPTLLSSREGYLFSGSQGCWFLVLNLK